jgi:integrase
MCVTIPDRGIAIRLARISATGDIYATQQLLGHADVSTTANIYVQGSPADLEEKLDKVWGE